MGSSETKIQALLKYFLKWLFLAIPIGFLVACASALLLKSLSIAEAYRDENLWIVVFLPFAGLFVGLLYHYYGESVVKGNNLIIEEAHVPKKVIPLKMAPMVFIGTVLTHLFGGSAGREGTAVQMGASISDQLSHYFGIDSKERTILLRMGVAAGFSSLFGTPLAGIVFALEVFKIGKINYRSLLPVAFVSILANYFCDILGAHHSSYLVSEWVELSPLNMLLTLLVSLLFGASAYLFTFCHHQFSSLFKRIKYAPLRPFIGGIVLAIFVLGIGNSKYIGLGIPTIISSFEQQMMPYDFLVKILLTTFTLAAGFKGGEVTPLFYIGATLGSALSLVVPLPVSLLAAMGFVAVFSGATNTPFACTFMGIELFGAESGVFIALSCFVAYAVSGEKGVYSSQLIGQEKGSDFMGNTTHEG